MFTCRIDDDPQTFGREECGKKKNIRFSLTSQQTIGGGQHGSDFDL
jgi:hypothetical protein